MATDKSCPICEDPEPIYANTTKAGFLQKVQLMYHGMHPQHIEAIMDQGLKPFEDARRTLLGKGVYTSLDFEKVSSHGEVLLKLAVDPGKLATNAIMNPWTKGYDSVQANAGMGDKHCLRSPSQLRIHGAVAGTELIPDNMECPILYDIPHN